MEAYFLALIFITLIGLIVIVGEVGYRLENGLKELNKTLKKKD